MKSRATQTKELDMVNGPLARKILIYSIPLMFSNLLQVFFNMTDVAVVGKFAGARALGSVGSTTIIITLTTGILLGMGGGVMLSRHCTWEQRTIGGCIRLSTHRSFCAL